MPRYSLLLAVFVLAVFGLGAGLPAGAQQPGLRVGVLHAQPHLCAGQEPMERDLGVLRLIYGQPLAPEQRLALPWFYRVGAQSGGSIIPGGTVRLSLQQHALWGLGTEGAAGAALAWEADPSKDPFWASRWWGSRLLPERGPPAPPASAAAAAQEPPVAQHCRSWPQGVRWRRAPGHGLTYSLQRAAGGAAGFGGPGNALELVGYAAWRQLSDDLAAGRLDLVWAEGQDLQGTPPAGPLGLLIGTQQVVLRFHPRLALTAGQRRLLSLAVNRQALVAAGPLAGFAPAQGYLESVAPRTAAPDDGLRWDSREARRAWLAAPAGSRGPRTLRLGYARHPLLEAWAERLAAQWQKTLEIAVTPQAVDPERLGPLWDSGSLDLLLDVLDLDDGSLQDAWRDGSPAAEIGAPAGQSAADAVPGVEQRLRAQRPYLPLLSNTSLVLGRGPGSAARIAAFCPGCQIVSGLP